MTPNGIHALRKSAALVHHVRDLRLRITHDGRPVAEIHHHVVPRTDAAPVRLTPCQLRVGLQRILGDALAGRPTVAFGLAPSIDPAIHLGACPIDGTQVHPFGVVTRPDGELTHAWFATTLPATAAQASLDALAVDAVDVTLRRDDALAITLVQLTGCDDVAALAHRAVASCGTEELLLAIATHDTTTG